MKTIIEIEKAYKVNYINGSEFRSERIFHKIKVREVAEMLGVSVSRVYRFEIGENIQDRALFQNAYSLALDALIVKKAKDTKNEIWATNVKKGSFILDFIDDNAIVINQENIIPIVQGNGRYSAPIIADTNEEGVVTSIWVDLNPNNLKANECKKFDYEVDIESIL